MSIAFRIFGNLRVIDARIAALSDLQISDLLNSVGALAETQTRRRIQEEKRSSQGEDWPELAESTKARYSALGKSTDRSRLLQFEGELMDSIQFQVSGDAAYVGSNKEYARRHQFGGGGIPAREFLGISDRNKDELEQLVVDFIDGSLL